MGRMVEGIYTITLFAVNLSNRSAILVDASGCKSCGNGTHITARYIRQSLVAAAVYYYCFRQSAHDVLEVDMANFWELWIKDSTISAIGVFQATISGSSSAADHREVEEDPG
jgi:hypothetical protein